MTISSERLLPCPFCGSDFLLGQEPYDNHPVAGQFYLYHRYGAIGSAARSCPIEVRGHFDTAAEAIAAWNRRSGVGCRRTDSELVGGKEQAEGGSAALRLSVIEECAKVADGVGEAYGMDETGWLDCSETIAMQIRTLKDNTHGA